MEISDVVVDAYLAGDEDSTGVDSTGVDSADSGNRIVKLGSAPVDPLSDLTTGGELTAEGGTSEEEVSCENVEVLLEVENVNTSDSDHPTLPIAASSNDSEKQIAVQISSDESLFCAT